jgi:hypothetical protein
MFFSFRSTTGSDDLRRPNVKSRETQAAPKGARDFREDREASELINAAVCGVFE